MSKKKIDKYKKRLNQLANPKYIDVDTYSLDHSVATLLASRLRSMANDSISHPCGITPEEWDVILDKIATTFERVLEDDYYEMSENDEKFQEGLDLFAKWFTSLWI